MNAQIPPDLDPVIQRLISEGRFRNENEAVAEGLRLLLKRDEFEREVQGGIDDLDSGNRIEADEAYAEARRRMQAVEAEQGR